MSTINILDHTGHVEIHWNDDEIKIDLSPAEGKSTKKENTLVSGLIAKAQGSGFECTVHDRKDAVISLGENFSLPSKADHVVLRRDAESVLSLMEEMVNTQLSGNQLLFSLDSDTEGSLIQKGKFNPANKGTYHSVRQIAGGCFK